MATAQTHTNTHFSARGSSHDDATLLSRTRMFIVLLAGSSVLGFIIEPILGVGWWSRPRWFALNAGLLTLLAVVWWRLGQESCKVNHIRRLEALAFLAAAVTFTFSDRASLSAPVLSMLNPDAWAAKSPVSYQNFRYVESTIFSTFGMSLFVVVRAALVPSPPQRTALLSLAASIPLGLALAFPQLAGADGEIIPGLIYGSLTNSAVMMTLAIGTATLISSTIYGLQQEVNSALKLGQYSLVRVLGEGGMGEVYEARHALLRRPVAIKMLKEGIGGENELERFEHEVQQTARLTHPNTITIFDYGRSDNGTFYYVMELLDGANLLEVVRQGGPMAPERVIHVLRGIAGALAEAHALGLIHRDIKPANIILCNQGGRPDVPKLLDFGLVKELSTAQSPDLTAADMIVGTPRYISPEALINDGSVDHRSDLYAVGAVAYFMVAGGHMFNGKGAAQLVTQQLRDTPQPLAERLGRSVHPGLEALILRCVAKDPQDRPQSAQALADSLAQLDGAHAWTAEAARQWWASTGQALSTVGQASSTSMVEGTLVLKTQHMADLATSDHGERL